MSDGRTGAIVVAELLDMGVHGLSPVVRSKGGCDAEFVESQWPSVLVEAASLNEGEGDVTNFWARLPNEQPRRDPCIGR